MRTYLSYSIALFKNKKAFTLVELLVTIAIIAILAAVGITIFSNTQQGARDSRRQADVDAMAKALEVNKVANSTTYPAMASSLFANGSIPTDTTIAQYSVAWVTAGVVPPPVPTTWAAGSINPTAPAPWGTATAGTVATGVPPATATAWIICTRLEKTGAFDCTTNQQ